MIIQSNRNEERVKGITRKAQARVEAKGGAKYQYQHYQLEVT